MSQYDDDFDRWCQYDWDKEDCGGAVRLPTCKGCGKTMTWHHTGTRWAMLDAKGKLHDCRRTVASLDEFAVLPDFDPSDPAQGLG